MAEERLMGEVFSALFEIVEVAINKEDIDCLEHIEKMASHRFMKEPTLFKAKRDFCGAVYHRKLDLGIL